MAFGRSNSLSINTSGTLFGNNNASSAPQSTGGLFGSTSQPQTGGLFGASSAAQASQPPQPGLFGQAQAQQPQTQSSQPSAGLFGGLNKPAASSATAQPGGGLFGGVLGGVQPSQSGGLLGGQQQQQQKPSLFGSSQQTATPSLFGGNTQQQPQQLTSTPSLFSSTQQNQPQQSGLFSSMNQNQPFKLGSHTVSGAPSLSALQQPVQTSYESIKGTTRFNDLHPDIQRDIETLDNMIQHHISNCAKVRETLPRTEEQVASLAPDVAYIQQFLLTVELGLDNDSSSIAFLKDLVNKDIEDATLSFRAITNLQLPAQFHYANRTNLTTPATGPSANPAANLDEPDATKPVDLISYFSRRADDLAKTLDLYQRQIREIEAHLRTMEAGTVEKAQQLTGSRNGVRDQRRELVDALKAIEGAILEAAKKVGQTRDMVTKETLGSVGAALL
ncbi:hypothetical protein CC78DRAFT_529787 [Lojkania enalia]|uniref:Nucleoporin NUP49/NSP49 n=1 Tax=Lojkania enalia TaxID=147567 RepID=A0A9P4KHA3_9PLEO|nr:hypothetical protein CC78DRAFT_529787 [Didymosphaeria enalia]